VLTSGFYRVLNQMDVIFSILAGAASHLFWDGFTINIACFVKMIPALSGTIANADIQIPVCKILQHSSTFIGGFVIAGYRVL